MAFLGRYTSVPLLVAAAALGGCAFDWDARRTAAGDGGPDGATTGCAEHTGALFCDDFEEGNADRWASEDGRGVAFVTESHAGTYAARASTTGVDQTASLVTELNTPVVSGPLHVRLFIFIPPGATTQQINLISLGDSGDAYMAVVLRSKDDTQGLTYLYGTKPPDDANDVDSFPATVPFGSWQCLELGIEVGDAPGGSMTLWRNGTMIANGNVEGADTRVADGYQRLELPIAYAAQAAPFTITVDDVVVDDAPIGCDD